MDFFPNMKYFFLQLFLRECKTEHTQVEQFLNFYFSAENCMKNGLRWNQTQKISVFF